MSKLLYFICALSIWSSQSSAGTNVSRGPSFLSSSTTQASTAEDFDQFFKRFNSDKNFQYSRIKFPLKNIFEDEYGKRTIKFNTSKDWKYTDIPKIKYIIINRKRRSKKQTVITLQIEETGVNVDYFFNLKNGKWYLEQTLDSST